MKMMMPRSRGHSFLLGLFSVLLQLSGGWIRTCHAQNGGPRPGGCLVEAYNCKLPRGQCGVYDYCKNENKVVVCSECGPPATKNAAPTQTCNFMYGRCLPNTKSGPGTPCTKYLQKSECPTKGYSCLMDIAPPATRATTRLRCCRNECPEGAWGGPKGFRWRNECGRLITCLGKRKR